MLASVELWRLARHATLAWHGVTSTTHASSSSCKSSLRPLASCLRLLQGEKTIDLTHHHVSSLLDTLIPSAPRQDQHAWSNTAQLAARYCSTSIRNTRNLVRGAASVSSSMGSSKVDTHHGHGGGNASNAAPPSHPSTTHLHTNTAGGWTSRDVLNTANMLSLARLCSGPGTWHGQLLLLMG